MRLIIAGGRNYRLSRADYEFLDQIHGVTEVVSGGCRGVDADGEAWASLNGIPVQLFPANWNASGRAAGPIRNRKMAIYADAAALFPGGRGVASMRREAEREALRIYEGGRR